MQQASLSFLISQSLLKLMSIELVIHPTISFSATPLSSCAQSFPASGSFQMSQIFESGGQSTFFSFSISLSNEYSGLTSLRTDWLILLSKGLSRVFSSTTVQRYINSSMLSFLYGLTLTSVYDYWKHYSSDYTDFCL